MFVAAVEEEVSEGQNRDPCGGAYFDHERGKLQTLI